MIAVGTKVRCFRGAHAGHDGTVVEHTGGLVTIESWLPPHEEFWALEGDVEIIAMCPPEHLDSARRIAAEKMRELSDKAREARAMLLALGYHDSAARIWAASLTFSGIAGKLGAS